MAAAETHLVTPGGALGDDAAPPDVRLVPGDAEEEEYEEPDPPLRPSACTGIGRLAASPLLGVARIAAAPFRILGRRRESLENEAAQLRERRKELAAARDAEVARATAALLEEKASSELGAAERLKAVERGYEKALEAASREHEAQLAAERTQLQADAARAVEEALRERNDELVDAVGRLKRKDTEHHAQLVELKAAHSRELLKRGKEIDEIGRAHV